ncbi:MAG: galactose ABC transporter substrate-binding protein [Erysipelotrichaceae bacterium]|nr:galactose ABC transporter substrate-binding protein [Erysipelotrichaceae bacterium]MDP3305603.1 galactose ABC transporter substrate-binding protein [Erysipelotrichaceae bacterium]
MKKLGILLFAFVLLGCEVKKTEIPLLIYDMQDAYMFDFEKKIQEATNGFFDLVTVDGQNSQIIQNEDIDKWINAKVPLLIVNPVDRLSVYSIIEKAKKSGTKIIFFNREPLAQDMDLYDSVYYVGADAAESAKIQAQIIMELFGNNPQLNAFDKNGDGVIQAVILKGEQGHQDAEARTKVVVETLTGAGYKVEVLDISIANFDRQTAKTAMDGLITSHGKNIEVVISNNDAMALGAIEALTDKGYFMDTNKDGKIDRASEVWIPVVGIDGLDIAMEQIESGFLYGTVFNDSQNMAEAIVELANLLIKGEDVSDLSFTITNGKYIWINYKKITNQ